MGYLDKRKSAHRRQELLWFFAVMLALISCLNFFFVNNSITDAILSFRIQFMYFAVLLFLLSIAMLNFKTALLGVFAFVINFGQIASKVDLFQEVKNPNEIWSEPIVKKLVLIKFTGLDSSYVKAFNFIEKHNPDFLIIMDAIDPEFLTKAQGLYQNSFINKKIALFTNETYFENGSENDEKSLWFRFTSKNDKKYALIINNFGKTDNAESFEKYNEYALTASKIGNSFEEPSIMVGGFNKTPWSESMAYFLKSSYKTNIFYGNYLSFLPKWLRKPCDFVYTHNGIDIFDQQYGKNIGSDYLPLFATLSIRPI